MSNGTGDGQQLHRDLGRLEGRVDGIDKRTLDMQTKLDDMHKIILRADGGVKTMVMIGSLGATVGAVISWVLTQWAKLRGH